jgi:hypothetical protein
MSVFKQYKWSVGTMTFHGRDRGYFATRIIRLEAF